MTNMSRHKHEPCLICDLWAKMPCSKRYTTPVNPAEVEGALIIGFWIRSRYEVPPVCQRHMQSLMLLDQQKVQWDKMLIEATEIRTLEAKAETYKARASAMASGMVASLPTRTELPPPNLAIVEDLEPIPTVNEERFPCPLCGTRIKNGELHACAG